MIHAIFQLAGIPSAGNEVCVNQKSVDSKPFPKVTSYPQKSSQGTLLVLTNGFFTSVFHPG